MDFSLHPIGDFLQVVEHEYSALVHEQKDTVPFVESLSNISQVTNFIDNNNSNVILMCTTFGLYVYENPVICSELRQFISTVLMPTNEFQKYIDANFEKIPSKPYSIIHYRLGDDEMVYNNDKKHTNTLYASHVLANKRDTDILLSDSNSLKKAILEQNGNIFMFNEPICHIGVSTDKSMIRQTLLEFFIIMKATSVKSYSYYFWQSGFVKFICTIYNIPLESYGNFRG